MTLDCAVEIVTLVSVGAPLLLDENVPPEELVDRSTVTFPEAVATLSLASRSSTVIDPETTPDVSVCGLLVKTSFVAVPEVTVNVAVSVLPLSVPVTVCDPATVAVQVAPVQEPLGEMENVVDPVTSPREFPDWSNPVAV